MKALLNGGAIALALGILASGQAWAQTVNTSDIFDGAVTSEKILDGTIKRRDLGDGIINGAKIEDGAVTSDDILDGTVKRRDLGDGIVNAAKIEDGAISAAKLGIANTWFIEDSGNDTTNCTRLRNRLSAVIGPAVIVLGPGTFDCGTNQVSVPGDVGLVGSGENATTITGAHTSTGGLVTLSDGASLRQLSIVNDTTGGGGNNDVALRVNGMNVRVSDVTTQQIGAPSFAVALFVDAGDCSDTSLTNVTSIASAGTNANRAMEIEFCGSEPIRGTNLRLVASDTTPIALLRFGGDVVLRNSSFSATTSVSGTVTVISSELDGAVSGSVVCVGNYDGAGAALSNGTNGSGGCV